MKFLLGHSKCVELSSKFSSYLPLPHLVVFHMLFIYSIFVLRLIYNVYFDGSWHDIDQAIAVYNATLLVAHSLFL